MTYYMKSRVRKITLAHKFWMKVAAINNRNRKIGNLKKTLY